MKKIIALMGIILLFKGLHARNVEVWVEGGNGSVYASGEKVSVKVFPHVSGYLYLYNIDAEGRVHLLFPKKGYSNYVLAGKIYHLPYDFGLETEWYAGSEPGIEYIYALITPYPLPYVEETWFVPLYPDEYYYDEDILVCFRFVPPHFFPRIYFYGWAYFYVRPRYYIYYHHPVPWYCYDCHHPHVIVGFWFDFCPIYVIEVYDCCSYYYYPRYYKNYRNKYRIRPIYRKISPKKVREYREIEKRYRDYDEPPVWAVRNPLREKIDTKRIYTSSEEVERTKDARKSSESMEKKVDRVESPYRKNKPEINIRNPYQVDKKDRDTYNYKNPFKVKR